MHDSLNPQLYPQFRDSAYHLQALEALRTLREAAGYSPSLHLVPDASNTAVVPRGRFELRISLPVQSYVWALAAYSEQAAGFRIQIVDLGTGQKWFSQPIPNAMAGGEATTPEGISSPLYVLPKPMLVIEPALLSVQIENLADVLNTVQVVLFVVEPEDQAAMTTPANLVLNAEADLARRALRGARANVRATVTSSGSAVITPGTSGAGEPELSTAIIDIAALGDNTIIPGSGTSRVVIYEIGIRQSGANPMTVRLKQGADPLMGPMTNFNPGDSFFRLGAEKPWRKLEPGRGFIINLSAAEQLSGYVLYRMEA